MWTASGGGARGAPARAAAGPPPTPREGPEAGWGGLPVAEVLGDGAPWIWNLAAALFPGVVQTLDWYHLREHFFSFASVQWPDAARAKRWVDAKMDALLVDRVRHVLRALRRLRGRNAEARKQLKDL